MTVPGARVSTAALCCMLLAACGAEPGPSPTESQPPTATIETSTASRGPVQETLDTYGTVDFDPKRVHTVAFTASGQVRRVLVAPGQVVAQGDALLVLGPLPGDTLEAERARIEVDYARRELERLRRLKANRLATNEQVHRAEKDVAEAEAVAAGMGDGDPPMPSRRTLAPFSGVVRRVPVEAGALVHSGDTALLLAPADAVIMRIGFEAEDRPGMREGMTASVAPVFPSGSGEAAATLAEIHSVVDPDTQLVEGVVRPERVAAWMVPGTAVRVRIVVRSSPGAVRVPRTALLSRNGETGVFVIENGTASWHPVDVGVEGDALVEIRGGVDPGAVVATTGRTALADGMAVVVAGAERS